MCDQDGQHKAIPTVDPNVLMAIASTKQTKVLFAEQMAKSQGKSPCFDSPCFDCDNNICLSSYRFTHLFTRCDRKAARYRWAPKCRAQGTALLDSQPSGCGSIATLSDPTVTDTVFIARNHFLLSHLQNIFSSCHILHIHPAHALSTIGTAPQD